MTTTSTAETPVDRPAQRRVRIPYRDPERGVIELPGRLFLADDTGVARPTVIYTQGFDSTSEEGVTVIGAAALRHGYHVLTYDGPGQGAVIRDRGIPLRPDWEGVLGAVVDWALRVPEIDGDRLAQYGRGLGGYLVSRYAARDHRSAAIVCHDGMVTFYASTPSVPEDVLPLIEDGDDPRANRLLGALMADDDDLARGLTRGTWVTGTPDAAAYVRATADYTLTLDDLRAIDTPMLLVEGHVERAYAGQSATIAAHLHGPHVHCRATTSHELHRAVFDYLGGALR